MTLRTKGDAHDRDRCRTGDDARTPRAATDFVPGIRASRVPGQVVPCGWCGKPALVPSRGRPPKWCSATCRHRAWEQRRAAESGLAAVAIVERIVEKVVVEKVTQTVEVPTPHRPRPQPSSPSF